MVLYVYKCEHCEEELALPYPLKEANSQVHPDCPNHELVWQRTTATYDQF